MIDVPLRGGIGDEQHRPTTIAAIRSPYELGIGHLRLDLRAISYPPGVTDLDASVGIGRLEVDVPSSVDLVVDGHTGAGRSQHLRRARRVVSTATRINV